jgi:hypothetical protein
MSRRRCSNGPGALEQPAAADAADQVAGVVADDGPESSQRDDQPDLEMPHGREDRGGDQRRLAGHGHAGGLGADAEEEGGVSEIARVHGIARVDEPMVTPLHCLRARVLPGSRRARRSAVD